MTESPVREYRIVVDDSGNSTYTNRLMIGSAVTGTVRIEWVQSRYGQIIPVNWSQVEYNHTMSGYYPLRYQVADAQNMIVQFALERDFEWLLLWEHDVIAPAASMIKLNEYMQGEIVPVVSGLYYTRSRPSTPLIFRGRGVGAYSDFEPGSEVWCDGVPTGFLLIHCGILRAMWAESSEYMIGNRTVRRIFETPRHSWVADDGPEYFSSQGTSDLDWCTRVMEGKFFEKAGWHDYQAKRWPFLVDTSLSCLHINPDGEVFP
jgi:hypothetical protein